MPTRLTIRQLQMIRALQQAGSVSAAAQQLQVSQSALSHRIREAERLLGSDLYLRQNKRLIPTVTGERVAHAANIILDELERTEQDIGQLQAGIERNLRFGLHTYASSLWLPIMMQSVAEQLPQISVQICADISLNPLNALRNNDIDMALISGHVTAPDLVFTPLFDDELVAVMSADHWWTNQPSIQASAFAQQTYIAHHTNPETGREYDLVFSANQILPSRVIRAGMSEAVMAMVEANLGVTLMPAWSACCYAEKFAIQIRPLAGEKQILPWHLACTKQSAKEQHVQDFAIIATALISSYT